MLYICIPTYNEAQTIGVLLWRIRTVFQDYSREYEIVVFDDGSTDSTSETLQPYAEILPLTLLGGRERVGYGGALDALCRAVSERTRYPRRDAMITLQADFTDQPEHLPELIKRFEGGADLVVAERPITPTTPPPVRRLRWFGGWAMRFSGAIPGVADPFGALRLYRISCAGRLRWRVASRLCNSTRAMICVRGIHESDRGRMDSRCCASGAIPARAARVPVNASIQTVCRGVARFRSFGGGARRDTPRVSAAQSCALRCR